MNQANRVEVVTIPRIDAPKRDEYAVALDGGIVFRTGGRSRWDYLEAVAFSRGLTFGLDRGSAPDPPSGFDR